MAALLFTEIRDIVELRVAKALTSLLMPCEKISCRGFEPHQGGHLPPELKNSGRLILSQARPIVHPPAPMRATRIFSVLVISLSVLRDRLDVVGGEADGYGPMNFFSVTCDQQLVLPGFGNECLRIGVEV